MVLAVLPMVELVGVTEGVHDGLEDRFQNMQKFLIANSCLHAKIQIKMWKRTKVIKLFIAT